MNQAHISVTRQPCSHARLALVVAFATTAMPIAARAQATQTAPSEPSPGSSQELAQAQPAQPAPSSSAPQQAGSSDSNARFKALEEKLAAQSVHIDALEQQLNETNAQLAAPPSESPEEQALSAWGFMDVNFAKVFLDNPRGVYAVRTPVKSTFFMNGINLYLKGTLAPTLSTLVETRLTFTPVGYESGQPLDVYMGNNLVQTTGNWSRGGETVRAPLTQMTYRQNGLLIERAHVDWKPLDWLSLRIGRYLTPYGIWNEDHGSPVLLGADNPNLINWEFVPTRQTGLQLLGSRELADSLTMDYAVTLSNGRGPVDEYKDLDANKALGLRLKLVYATDDMSFRVGGYGYQGTYTDSQHREYVQVRPDLTLDTSYPVAVGSTESIQVAYKESILALDALVRLKGFRLFGEYARRRVIFTHAPPFPDDDKLLNGIPYAIPLHVAGFIGTAYYVMGAYEIDASRILEGLKITPYAGFDEIRPNGNVITENMKQYRVGLNIKPSPWATMKFEAVRIVPDAEALGSRAWAAISQLAIAF